MAAEQSQATDGLGSALLELHHRDTRGQPSRWVWRCELRPPTAAVLGACGFPGSIFVPSQGATNLLLLLHGRGDSPRSFAKLATKMELPQTAALALRAPIDLPFGIDGSQWHDSFDVSTGELIQPQDGERRRVLSLERESRMRLLNLLDQLEACGWPRQRVFVLGYAQGGTAALDLALSSRRRLGGVVSVCGHCLHEAVAAGLEPVCPNARATPILVTIAKDDRETAPAVARKLFDALRTAFGGPLSDSVTLRELPGRGAMGESAAQMRCIMEFFASHLEIRSKALEDPSLMRVA
eukprot:scaffold228178_cov44-Tisochrysis_lutea.AAC.1